MLLRSFGRALTSITLPATKDGLTHMLSIQNGVLSSPLMTSPTLTDPIPGVTPSHKQLRQQLRRYSLEALHKMPDQRPDYNPKEVAKTVVSEINLKASVIFETSWRKMEARFGNSYICPREVVWLNGAPGSGKGTNIPFIMRSRGLSKAITMSQLLEGSEEVKHLIEKGELVPDALVLDALLNSILNPDTNDGAGLVIDGFPRTALQVDFVKLLFDKLSTMSLERADTADEWRFPRPSFKVVILYVNEEESVKRQLTRAVQADLHNKRVLDAGTGDVWDVRTTDVSEDLCRRRYQVFKAHYHTILRLKQYFPFSLIDAMGSQDDCRAQIMRELRYQSSLDLDEKTYAAIRHLPLARDLVRVARQRLVFRLDSYCKRNSNLFQEVIKLIGNEVLPLLKQCSLAGHTEFKSRHPLLLQSPQAVDILVDVLSDRGFSVAHSIEERVVPIKVDLKTGSVDSIMEDVHKFRITFQQENVRDLRTPSYAATAPMSVIHSMADDKDTTSGATFIPSAMSREARARKKQMENHLKELETHPPPIPPPVPQGKVKVPPPGDQADEMHAAIATATLAGAINVSDNIVDGYNAQSMTNQKEQLQQEEEETVFLKGWDSADIELNEANRNRRYGFEIMNERED
jgi:adenylate kinase family enzyme